jgi:methylglyoxal synthase
MNSLFSTNDCMESLTMQHKNPAQKHIALVAHDNKKKDLLEWVNVNRESLSQHVLYATGTTGALVSEALSWPVIRFQSGPLGGDQQIGAKIADGVIDCIVFFWDPLEPQPHDPDVKALLRIAAVWNIPVACNLATADFMISSPLMRSEYHRTIPDFKEHLERFTTKPEAGGDMTEITEFGVASA